MRSRTVYSLIAVLITLLLGVTHPELISSRAKPATKSVQKTYLATDLDGKTFPVAKVVDGDTLDISVNGNTVRIRLIGIDTPEVVDPRKVVQCFGREASDKAKQILTGTQVRIELDPSQGMYDKYDRLLAYIYAPLNVKQEGLLFNKYMIAEGYAHEYTYDLPYKYQKDFKAAEVSAREGEKGLWSPTSCNGDTKKPAA